MSSVSVTFDSPLGDKVSFRDLTWSERLGGLPDGRVTLLSKSPDIKPNDLLGKQVSVHFEVPGSRARHFNGYVTRLRRGGTSGQLYRYEAQLHPWLWFLTRTSDCRIFLDKTVKDILKEVFDGHAVAHTDFTSLYSDYPKFTQCVQYRETDFNFVSRLMEQAGIYYRFEYSKDGKQVMRMYDASASHSDGPNLKELPFLPDGGRQAPEQGYLLQWGSARTIQPGTFALHGLHYDQPNSPLNHQAGSADPHDLGDYEIYDSAYEFDHPDAGTHYSTVRNDQSGAEFDVYQGETTSYDLQIGNTFLLQWHADTAQNIKYLATSGSYFLSDSSQESRDAPLQFQCRFAAIPAQQQFRSAATTPRPFVQGPQLATITGPSGAEIYTDDLGRVKVLFHWDRYGARKKGKGDHGSAIAPEDTSCWVPVAQIWAGNNFGAIFLPRIGQEVVIEFLEGDPDRPIVTGRVYNKENPPPWPLTPNQTQSGILTRSSPKGAYANANMVRFEDKKGSEQLSIHAEKDQDISVEHDETHDVGNDRTKTIGHDETTSVKHDRTESVGNNESITIGKDRTESVGANENISIDKNRTESVGGDESIDIGKGRTHSVGKSETQSVGENRSVSIGKKLTLDVGDDRATSVGKNDSLQVGKKFTLVAQDEITLQTGSATLTMKSDGTVQLNGQDITVVGSGKIGIKASGDLVLKGSKVANN